MAATSDASGPDAARRTCRLVLAALIAGACVEPNPAYERRDQLPVAPDAARPAAAMTGRGLVGHWRFDDGPGSTRAADSSGQGNHGALEDLDPRSAWKPGRLGGALEFPAGRRPGVRVAPSPSLDGITTALTIAAWVNRGDGANYNCVLSRQDGPNQLEHYNLCFYGDALHLYLRSATNRVWPEARSVPRRRWVHVAATYDGAMARVYVDGHEAGAAMVRGPLTFDANPVYVGTNKNGPNYPDEAFVGLLDEVMLFARALTAAEIAALASGGEDGRVAP